MSALITFDFKKVRENLSNPCHPRLNDSSRAGVFQNICVLTVGAYGQGPNYGDRLENPYLLASLVDINGPVLNKNSPYPQHTKRPKSPFHSFRDLINNPEKY